MDQIRGIHRLTGQFLTRRVLLFLLALASTIGCASSTGRYVRPAPPIGDNTLGPGDVFGVRVFGEAELSQDYRVASNGTIDFPYIGRLTVQGLEPTEVADQIRQKLEQREILQRPQVSVFVREIHSRQILVLGQVQHPGTFPFEQNMTIVQAITAAGGFGERADQGLVRLTRRVRGGRRSYAIPVDMIAEGRVENVLLAPNDIVVVAERPF